ncbi:MAG TPA: Sir2 family NAD-dependent protein deacetylase [Gemmatimonadales bacterium]|nr:Sir2 family NAD-dependent protein deacetylase [Gemmatimonadales bacterium]
MRILTITGAGISAQSGIPTFRGAGGYWRTHDQMALATHAAFDRNPALVWEWYKERRAAVERSLPNAAHVALTKLGLQCPDSLLVTQNVDDLHVRAVFGGQHLSASQMVQIHGDLFVSRCEVCGFSRRAPEEDKENVPLCPITCGPLRPGVVWFDEELEPALVRRIDEFLRRGPCDAVLVVGTTAQFDYIVDWMQRARGQQTRIFEINPEQTEVSHLVTDIVREPATLGVPRIVDQLLTTG